MEKLVVARLSRADAADLIAVSRRLVSDVGGTAGRGGARSAGIWRRWPGTVLVGRISRVQMLKATAAGNACGWSAIGDGAGRARRGENVLAPLVAAENAASSVGGAWTYPASGR